MKKILAFLMLLCLAKPSLAAAPSYWLRNNICNPATDSACADWVAARAHAKLAISVDPSGAPANAMDIPNGDLPGASPGPAAMFTVTNAGGEDTGVLSVALDGEHFSYAGINTCTGATLARNASCSITVQPIANDNGTYSGTLTVSSAPGGTVVQTLSGTASDFLPPDPCDPFNAPVVGTTCSDGSVYAGVHLSVPMFTQPCDEGQSLVGGVCTGTRLFLPYGAYGIIVGASSLDDGLSNTELLMAYDTPAADSCRSHGGGWYLPARSEAYALYTNRTAIGGFSTSEYWSSSEYASPLNYAYVVSFSSGSINGGDTKTITNNYTRCVRKGWPSGMLSVSASSPSKFMNLSDGVPVNADLIVTVANVGLQGTGILSSTLSGDTAHFMEVENTCRGIDLFPGSTCSITLRPQGVYEGLIYTYSGTLQISGSAVASRSLALYGESSGTWRVACSTSKVPGCEAPDGAVYAGVSDSADMYVKPCDEGMTSGGGYACSGTRLKFSSLQTAVVTGASSNTDGLGNTDIRVGHDAPAADRCRALGAGWYLPAHNELQTLYDNRIALGGFELSTSSLYYWSSTEFLSSSYTWIQFFQSGGATYTTSTNTALMRCARKDWPSAMLSVSATSGNPTTMNVVDGVASGDVVFTVRNVGPDATGGISSSIAGDTANFTEVANTCTSLASGASCAITVRPQAPVIGRMNYSGTLNVSASPGGTHVRPMSGLSSSDTRAECGDPLVIGCRMPGGEVYAGLTPDGNVPMYVSPCDAGQSGADYVCAGTRSTLAWGPAGVDIGTLGQYTGKANTATLAARADAASYVAASYCANLVAHGYDDWYLPARYELAALQTKMYLIGNFDTGSTRYWSSSTSSTYSTNLQFNNGDGYSSPRTELKWIRCARK